MAVVTGTRFSFTDTVNAAIDMSDSLSSISPSEVPLLALVGRDSLSFPCRAPKHEWLEAELRPLDGAVAASGTTLANTTDPVAFNVVAGQGLYLQPNDILKIESELLRVTAVSTDSITVARAFGGSTAATHADSTPWSIVGRVDVQDAAVPVSRTTTKVARYNYTQIYNDSIVVTTTEKVNKRYVAADIVAEQTADSVKIAWLTWERSLLHGRKVAPSAGVASAMDGILPVITTNAYAKAGAALTEAHIKTALMDIWTAGGNPDTIMVGAFQKSRINDFLDSMRMTTRTDRTAGVVIERYTGDFGTQDIILNRNMPPDTVLVFDKSKIGFGPMTGHSLKVVRIPDTTWFKNVWQVVGQYTSEVRNEKAHAKITGLAVT